MPEQYPNPLLRGSPYNPWSQLLGGHSRCQCRFFQALALSRTCNGHIPSDDLWVFSSSTPSLPVDRYVDQGWNCLSLCKSQLTSSVPYVDLAANRITIFEEECLKYCLRSNIFHYWWVGKASLILKNADKFRFLEVFRNF